jgi:hypothetical protein
LADTGPILDRLANRIVGRKGGLSVEDLERLRVRAIQHGEEAPNFRALLDATSYAHTPLFDDSGRIRFIQFPHPDTRKDTLPFFTDVEQAFQAAQGRAKVLGMSGGLLFELKGEHCVLFTVRELFESRPSMHFFLNPYSEGSRQFAPFEVRALLKQSQKWFSRRLRPND